MTALGGEVGVIVGVVIGMLLKGVVYCMKISFCFLDNRSLLAVLAAAWLALDTNFQQSFGRTLLFCAQMASAVETAAFSQQADVGGGSFSEFLRMQFRAVAAAMSMTYEQLTGDLHHPGRRYG